MNHILTRRGFLRTAVTSTALVGLPHLTCSHLLPRVSAAEAKLPASRVRFAPEIEPLVRLLEETPRERVLEEFALKVRTGTSYREVLAALLLAGVRNIQPRPVGFKFHAVLVVNSAHLASLNSPDADRWLPIFWALDQFKSSQARDEREGDWTMAPVEESATPPAHQAKRRFIEAMDNWDVPAADAAVAALARSIGAQEIFELFARYGSRDFRDIGHKAIYTANSWRTLQNIGWQHAEPVLRSLAYALLDHEEGNPAQRDGAPDRPGRHNQSLAAQIRTEWLTGRIDPAATQDFADTLRQAGTAAAAEQAVQLLNRGIAPQSVWDALHCSAAELLMHRPGIVALHSLTTANAMHYAWQQTGNDQTRRWLLLQAASFMTLFRDRLGGEQGAIDSLADLPTDSQPEGVDEIFSAIGSDRARAARLALGYLSSGGDPSVFVDTARRFIYLKGTDSHDYKFSEAVLEDYGHLSQSVGDRFLAASVFQLRGSGAKDNQLVQRIRAAFG